MYIRIRIILMAWGSIAKLIFRLKVFHTGPFTSAALSTGGTFPQRQKEEGFREAATAMVEELLTKTSIRTESHLEVCQVRFC
ncbi:MAG: hypothetical protein GY737_10195 [Desulfobacteraceae bacterium]|nr:hypothetical protein [Desulfobacteraceae bacterium]